MAKIDADILQKSYYSDNNKPLDEKTIGRTRYEWLLDWPQNSGYRFRGMKVIIQREDGNIATIGINNTDQPINPKEYWFKDGTTDTHFIPYQSEVTFEKDWVGTEIQFDKEIIENPNEEIIYFVK